MRRLNKQTRSEIGSENEGAKEHAQAIESGRRRRASEENEVKRKIEDRRHVFTTDSIYTSYTHAILCVYTQGAMLSFFGRQMSWFLCKC